MCSGRTKEKSPMSTNHPVKLTVLMLVALLLLSCGVGSIRCATVTDNSTDLLSLFDFKQAINDPTGALNGWSTDVPHCQWMGVNCSQRHAGRVTALNLTDKGLSGTIPASVANLTFVRRLDLSNNNFSGQIPDLSNLQKMQVLNLSYNSLDGIIPDTLTNCSNLKELHLYNNSLTRIPPQIGLLTNLVYMAISNNNLSGIIPPTLGNMTSLVTLYLGANNLGGSIPDEIGKLPNIKTISLAENMLSGSIPGSISNLSSIQTLDFRANLLNETLPINMGDRLHNLQYLYLGNNMLEGHIPASLSNASMLEAIYLVNNSFTGQIPTTFGKLSRLSVLSLQINRLEANDSEGWEFLQGLGQCRNLTKLRLAGNQLQGVIPHSIGNLSQSLQYLIFGGNKLSGIVPPSIGNLSGLTLLTLDTNSLTGDIGQWIGNLKNLQSLYLSNNKFTGPIPTSISNISGLLYLYLRNNSFEASIPPSLGKLGGLLYLDLSHNNLQGSIPLEIGNLMKLVDISLSSNKLTGEIPSTLERCQSLARIRMDQNLLTGSIPAFLGNITSLSMLNLSNNNLSGNIPRTLGDLPLLVELDLSHNHLQGEIPTNGIFKNATAVSLEDNWGLCGGVIDPHTPSCPSASQKFSRQYYLVRILIPIFGFMSLVLLVYVLFLVKKVPRRDHLQSSFGEYFLKVSYNDLAQATKNFSESSLIGRGSYGSVYKGRLKEQKVEVAVKVFNLEMRGAERSFIAECEALRSIQHRNLLPIITACSTVDNTGNVFKALVYEFMPNGNLDTWLHHKEDGNKDSKLLGLNQRISIAVNIADALDYLHHDCGRPTVHCDLKPSNILLDEDMNALLGDFGIARFYADSRLISPGSVSSIGVKGTIGYIAPEYAQGGHAEIAGDVYSFGIVLLEMVTGKRPTDPMFNDGLDIVKFVGENFPHQIDHVIDDHLKQEYREFEQANIVTENVVASLLQVALSCAHPLPSRRMSMKVAANKIHAIKTSSLGWKSK